MALCSSLRLFNAKSSVPKNIIFHFFLVLSKQYVLDFKTITFFTAFKKRVLKLLKNMFSEDNRLLLHLHGNCSRLPCSLEQLKLFSARWWVHHEWCVFLRCRITRFDRSSKNVDESFISFCLSFVIRHHCFGKSRTSQWYRFRETDRQWKVCYRFVSWG